MSSSLLKNLYLFKNLKPNELDAIGALGESQQFMAGDTVFVRGEAAKALYLIKHGSVKIQQTAKNGDNIDVATLATGSHFGEMAFVDGEPRSATAAAAEMTEMIIIPYEKLALYLKTNTEVAVKFYRELSHFLAGRLRATTSDLSYAREKNLSHM
ncbi:MAG: cyclic nucleotide-binding domain-containing protein [Bdellovibrionales bacterium]|nr:cyclic nucleotide-binding domain-containing protein [Bdellovibrionales bacterium]